MQDSAYLDPRSRSRVVTVPLHPVLFYEAGKAQAYVLPSMELVIRDAATDKSVVLASKAMDAKAQVSHVCTALRHCFPAGSAEEEICISVYGVHSPREDGAGLAVEDVATMFSRRVGAPRLFVASGYRNTASDLQLFLDTLFVGLAVMQNMVASLLLEAPPGPSAAAAAADVFDEDGNGKKGFTPFVV